MIHVERVELPDGLRALAYRDRLGNLVVYVSDGLDAKGQRAAIMEAIRASRRAGWRKPGLLPVGVGVLVTVRALLGRVGPTIGARPAAWGAAATATALGASAAGIFITSAPQPHRSLAAGRPPGPGTAQPSGQLDPLNVDHDALRGRDARRWIADHHSRGSPPSPSPSPSPTGGTPGICVIVLGIKVCLPPVSVSLKV